MYCPELVIVDEAHTCVAPASAAKSSQAHLRYALLRKLADDPDRHLLLLTATPHSGDDAAWQSLIGLLDDRLAELPADLSGRDRENDRKLLAGFMIQRQRADIREYPARGHPVPGTRGDRDQLPAHPRLPGALRRGGGVRARTGRRPDAEQRAPAGALVSAIALPRCSGLQPGRRRAAPT